MVDTLYGNDVVYYLMCTDALSSLLDSRAFNSYHLQSAPLPQNVGHSPGFQVLCVALSSNTSPSLHVPAFAAGHVFLADFLHHIDASVLQQKTTFTKLSRQQGT